MATTQKHKGKTEIIQNELLKWATEEMKFHTESANSRSKFQLPTEDEFKILCSGPLVDVWKHAIKHVKSVQNSNFMKGNVELKKGLGAFKSLTSAPGGNQPNNSQEHREGQHNLNEQHSSLLRELKHTKSEVTQLHREVSHAMEEVAGAELTYQNICQRVRDLQCKESLLHIVKNCAEETVVRYTEYTERLEKRFADITDKRDHTKENFMFGSSHANDEELETESCHMVRQACDDICKFIFRSLDTSTDRSKLESCKSDLLDKADRAAAINSMQSLASALATNAELDARRLREKTSSLNISKDAAEISFTYDPKEGLHDSSSPLSTTDTVKELLLANSGQHVLRWFKEQEHKNEEWKLSSRLTETLDEMNKLLSRVIGDHPSHLAVARDFINARMRLAEERAVAPCLRKESVRLKEKIDEARQRRKELQLKHSQIQDFQKLVARKQTVISGLARFNASSPTRLKTHRQQVEAYLESRSISVHLTEVQMLPTRLQGALISELDCFLGLLMPCLLTLHIDSHTRICVLDLSISPDIYAVAYDGLQVYTDLGKALEFPSHKSVECLPLHVLQLHACLHQYQSSQRQRQVTAAAITDMTCTADDVNTFIGLRKTAERHDQVQCNKLLPQLEESIQLTIKHTAELDNLKKAVATWWEQPAQWITPWVRSGGLTFDQWMQHWRTLITQAHSKYLANRGNQV